MFCIIDFVFIVIHYLGPDPVHVLVITANKILVTIIETQVHPAIILIHIDVAVFNRKIFRANLEFRQSRKNFLPLKINEDIFLQSRKS